MEREDVMENAAGGKVTRRSFRTRASSTPYDRPPLAERKRGGLVSKIFARAASSILPSVFFSSSEKDRRTSTSEALPNSREEGFDRVSSHDANNPGAFAEKSQSFADPSIDKLISEKARNDCDSGEIAEIELWLKQRTFSSELANCLMDILRSSTSGLSHDDPHTSGIGSEAEGTMRLKAPTKPSQCSVLSEQGIKPKPQDTSLMKLAHDAGSSPAEIAKAYIKNLATESYPESRGRLALAKNSFENGASTSKMLYSSVSKPPICWRGPSLESNHNYFTSKSGRVNVGQHSFQQTPYSRSIFSRSKFNSGRGSQKTPDVPLPIWERSSTCGSVMVQEKYDGSTPKEVGNSHIAVLSATKDVTKISSSTLQVTSKKYPLARSSNSHIPEATENDIGYSSVHPKSTENARKILEHLNITIPPKEKILHLELEKTETKAVKRPSSSLRLTSDKVPLARSLNYRTATAEASASNIGASSVHPNSNQYTQAAANPAMGKYLLPPFTSRRKPSKLGEKSFDEGFNFTFPMPASLNASSEPSTPTLSRPSPATGFGLPMAGGSGHVFSGSNKARHLTLPVKQR